MTGIEMPVKVQQKTAFNPFEELLEEQKIEEDNDFEDFQEAEVVKAEQQTAEVKNAQVAPPSIDLLDFQSVAPKSQI